MECVDGKPCEVCGFGAPVAGARRNPAMTMVDVAQLFDKSARRIWGDATIDSLNIEVTDAPPKTKGVLAALRYVPPVRAIGTSLVHPAAGRHYTVLVSPRLLERDVNYVTGIMLHEALHIGYPRHDADFRYMANKFGAPITESLADGGGIRLQEKIGARYVDTGEVFAIDDIYKARARLNQLEREDRLQGGRRRFRMIY